MARAALQWSLEDAAAAAGVSRRTVLRFERDHRDVKPELIEAMRRAYEAAGVRFLDSGADSGGVVPPPSASRRLSASVQVPLLRRDGPGAAIRRDARRR
jgi:transcriptional regulator with XRE-family HTH domain